MAFKYGTTSPTAINYDGTDLTVLQYGIDGYDVLDYIEFSGTQFIRTGISSLTTPYSVETTFNKTNTSTADQCLFGQRQLGKFSNIYNTYFENDPLGVSASNTVPTNKKSTLVVTNTSVSIDGTTLVSSSDVGNRSTSYEALIGAFSEDSYANAKWFFQGRIYEMKIINAGVLYRHFIPTMRKSDNVVGLYDKLNNVFYTNSGSGSFVAGNNIKGYPVWGKPYSLSTQAGSYTTITVKRTSSPNQNASTGTLSSGSVIYYGDVLTISYSVSSGYTISTRTVNGNTFTSGQSFTVSGPITVVTTAVASWTTLWTGNVSLSSGVKTRIATNTVSIDAVTSYRITVIGTIDGDYTNIYTNPSNASIIAYEAYIDWPIIEDRYPTIGTLNMTKDYEGGSWMLQTIDEVINLTFTNTYGKGTARVTKIEYM